jgi:hypothetical protein
VALACGFRGRAWPGVAWCLPALAPHLAPGTVVSAAKVRRTGAPLSLSGATPNLIFLCYIIRVDRVVRRYRTARRHRVGKAHAMHVITTTTPDQVPASGAADARLVWIGPDDRGIELEIVALDLD